MDTYLQITQINDFIFCPRSIYFHNIFKNTSSQEVYHQAPQKVGQAAHSRVDNNTYSTRKDILTGLFVYSQKYELLGRIDILNMATSKLTERKYAISAVYDGFRYQLYAQYFALCEMGYVVNSMCLHSLKDNKTYSVSIPNEKEVYAFESTLRQIRKFSFDIPFSQNINKCRKCIYNSICDVYEEE